MVVRGVPNRIARDGWWLDDTDPPRGVAAGPLFVAVLALADVLFWGVLPGAGIAVWMAAASLAITLTVWKSMDRARVLIALVLLLVAIAPLIEVVQFSTVVVAVMGLLAFGITVSNNSLDPSQVLRVLARLPGRGIVRSFQDLFAMRVALPSKGGFRSVLFDWALPLGVGGIFALLLVAANPLLDRWLLVLTDFDASLLPSGWRVVFWMLLGVFVWPLLKLADMSPTLNRTRPDKDQRWQSGFLNARSVLRALITFNLIFGVQTMLDIGYLWSGVALPDGMTYAQYAHRGAYPLLATAVLAGVFALIAQPYLGTGKAVRWLLYVWVAQTVVLVISSILRLDLYVDVYGLTRLRFAAFVWMTVVAMGLTLIIMQMVGRHSVRWFMHRALALGLIAIYICNLVNIDGYVARHNLADDRANDHYLCELGEGAWPAIRAHEIATGEVLCYSYRPYLSQRNDWREWGYRNARLHRSLAALEEAQ